MPIYSYKCEKCGECHDAMKSFSEADDEELCPSCGGKTKRVFSTEPAAVIYKGSGYYCTDNPHGGSCCCGQCKGGK